MQAVVCLTDPGGVDALYTASIVPFSRTVIATFVVILLSHFPPGCGAMIGSGK